MPPEYKGKQMIPRLNNLSQISDLPFGQIGNKNQL